MCFRPSAIAGSEPQVQISTCPSCGLPVPASVGMEAGECPHCHKPIPVEPKGDAGPSDPSKLVKLL